MDTVQNEADYHKTPAQNALANQNASSPSCALTTFSLCLSFCLLAWNVCAGEMHPFQKICECKDGKNRKPTISCFDGLLFYFFYYLFIYYILFFIYYLFIAISPITNTHLFHYRPKNLRVKSEIQNVPEPLTPRRQHLTWLFPSVTFFCDHKCQGLNFYSVFQAVISRELCFLSQ